MLQKTIGENKPIDIEKNPQDTTRDLRTNLADLRNIEASQEQDIRHKRGGLLESAAGAAGAAAEMGGHAGRKGQSSLFREAPGVIGESLVEDAAKRDALNLQGAMQEEQIQFIQQKATLERYNQQTIQRDKELALINARAAFDYGMEAKQLIYAQDGALADYAFKVLSEDFERKRITERELQAIIQASQRNMLEYELESEKIMKQIGDLFEIGLTEQNVGHAMQLLTELHEWELRVQREAARAANTAGILGGLFQIGGAVIGGIYGGPAGAAAGSKIGETVGNIFNRRR